MYSSSRASMTPFSIDDLGGTRLGGDSEAAGSVDEPALYRKLQRQLLPPFFIMVMLCYIDRTNLAFASIQLNADMQWPPSVYGLGSGLFFLGYAAFQIPSNLILKRVGGPTWLSVIIVTWGICAVSFAFMRTRSHFYILRLLLGVAEAGAFPGMWYCLSQFFPPDELTVPFAIIETGVIVSHVLAAPIAAAVLSLDGMCGLRGWQWLFLLEGLPSIGLGLVIRYVLPTTLDAAVFLTDHEKRHIASRIAAAGVAAAAAPGGAGNNSLLGPPAPLLTKGGGVPGGGPKDVCWSALRNPYVWYMAVCKMVRDVAGFGIIFFTPMLVNAMLSGTVQHLRATGADELKAAAAAAHAREGDSGARAALLTSLPFAVSALASLAVAHHSQSTGERVYHIAVPYILCGIGFACFTPMLHLSLTLGFVALTSGVIGIYAGGAPSLALLSELAAGPGLLIALPFYNSVGNIGGFFGPYFVGLCLQRYNSFAVALPVLGVALTTAGVMTLALGPWLPQKSRPHD